MSSWILNIETSTKNCSVALSYKGNLINAIEQSSESYSHGEQLHPCIDKLISESKIKLSNLSAVAVSKGPGSYTGLRIGVSAAKGLCYSLNIPLISLNSLSILSRKVKVNKGTLLAPMIDARRLEVYTQLLDYKYKIIKNTWAEIITKDSFSSFMSNNSILAFGTGSQKTKNSIKNLKYRVLDKLYEPSSKEMTALSYKKFLKKEYENIAYFELYYLKEFYNPASK